MAIADTVYYEDQDVRITGRDLWIGTTSHPMEFINSVKIETLPVRQSLLPERMEQALAMLYLTLLVAWLLNFLGQLAGLGLPQDLLRTIGVPLLLLLLIASLRQSSCRFAGSRDHTNSVAALQTLLSATR